MTGLDTCKRFNLCLVHSKHQHMATPVLPWLSCCHFGQHGIRPGGSDIESPGRLHSNVKVTTHHCNVPTGKHLVKAGVEDSEMSLT